MWLITHKPPHAKPNDHSDPKAFMLCLPRLVRRLGPAQIGQPYKWTVRKQMHKTSRAHTLSLSILRHLRLQFCTDGVMHEG
eukprot:5132783-Prymnesium_polylepis.2